MNNEYVKVSNQSNFISEFVSNHIKITLSNGNIIRVFDTDDNMNVIELFDNDDNIISGLTQDELSQNNSFKEFIV